MAVEPAAGGPASDLTERFAAAVRHHREGRLGEAVAGYRAVVALKPDHTNALNNLGVALKTQGRFDEAVAVYRIALAFKPASPAAYNNLGISLQALGRIEEAAAAFGQAIGLSPDYAEAHNGLATALQGLGRLDEALDAAQQAVALKPDNFAAHFSHANIRQARGEFDAAKEAYARAARLVPDSLAAYSSLLFCQQSLPNYTPQERLADARRFGDAARRTVRARYSQWTCPPQPARLRVGLVSGDLHDHAAGYFLESVIREIDPGRVELIAYPTRDLETALTHRIKPYVSAWRPLYDLGDEDAARLVHADGVHVLIDLSGHTAYNRLAMFAWKPAPVQATWVGYFATTGIEEIDYIVSDKYLAPPEDEDQYTETPWRLPNSACLTPPDYPVEPNAPPVFTEGVFTFGCFNNLRKVTDEVVALWSRILLAAPGSRLFLKAPQLGQPSVVEETRQRFAAHGVPSGQLVLEGSSPRGDYLRAYHRVDVALDPFPYPGATTSIEGLWMGVPVITRRGDRLLSRVGEATAQRAGLADWIAEDDEAYVAMALRLVGDPAPLVELRAGLRSQVLASSLYDGAGFARDLEEALWGMWNRHAD